MRIILKTYVIFWTICLGVSLFSMPNCFAGCVTSEPHGPRLLSFFLPSSLSIISDVADDSVIWRSEWLSSEISLPLCNTTQNVMLSAVSSFISDEDSALHAYRTGIRGVLMKVYYRDRIQGVPEHELAQDEIQKIHIPASSFQIKIIPEFRIELIKIHRTETGTNFINGGLITLKADGIPVANVVIHPVAMRIRIPGCDVLTDNVVVNMGDHDQKEFRGKGTFTSYTPLAVTLHCAGSVKVNYAVRGTRVDDSTNGLISLDKGPDSAQGIAVQIADEHSRPVQLNQYGLWKEHDGSGLVEIKFRARYLQTGERVTAGKANATATVSFIYR